MKTFYKYILCLMMGVGIPFLNAQQQTLYTNFNVHPYLYNPAYAGSSHVLQINGGYRNQWTGFAGAPKTYILSGYGAFKKRSNMAVGGMVISDRIGLINRNSFYGSYAYHVKIDKLTKLGMGLSAGASQYNVKVYDANPYDGNDDLLATNILNANTYDGNAGFYLYHPKYFVSLSFQQFLNSKIYWKPTIGRLSPHYYAAAGYNIKINKDFVLQPSVLARMSPPVPYQLEYNLKLTWKDMIWIGGGYRTNDCASGIVGLTIDKQFSAAYAYDYTLSELQQYSSGTHEITLSYTMSYKKKKTKAQTVQEGDEEEFNNTDNSLKTNLRNKKKVPAPLDKKNSSTSTEPKKEGTSTGSDTEKKEEIKEDAPKVEQPTVEPKTETPKTEEPK
jgi:type IX secretion system PorP/SprF family membrane protein